MTFLLFLALTLFPLCEREDSNMCYWDASTNGGTSFIAITDNIIIPLSNHDIP